MARYTRMATLNEMYNSGLVVVFYDPEPETVINVAKACAAGGARLIEFTNRGDFAYQVFIELEKYCAANLPQLITGVGSVADAQTAGLYINSGANFIVGPLLNPDVAKLCNRRKIPYSPGCGTVSEIAQAEELGCEIVKIFPGKEVGGPGFVKSVKAPCPWVSLMPTGGVDTTEQSLGEWFKAGIVCAGIGSNLITKEMLQSKNYKAMTEAVSRTLSIIGELKR